jgi:hypothetical protein
MFILRPDALSFNGSEMTYQSINQSTHGCDSKGMNNNQTAVGVHSRVSPIIKFVACWSASQDAKVDL